MNARLPARTEEETDRDRTERRENKGNKGESLREEERRKATITGRNKERTRIAVNYNNTQRGETKLHELFQLNEANSNAS